MSKPKKATRESEEILFNNLEEQEGVHFLDVKLDLFEKHGSGEAMQQVKRTTTLRGEMQAQKTKLALVVNVASKCGHTNRHYTEMVELHSMLRDKGFNIFAFPCNQFGSQESKDADFVQNWAHDKYEVGFPMFEKVKVNGPSAHPIFAALKDQMGVANCKWNFDKFLLDHTGKAHFYGNAKEFKPLAMADLIKKLLKKL